MARKDVGDGLTNPQLEFMRAMQDIVCATGIPATVGQLRVQLRRSDSLVRSQIKILVRTGYVLCVGRQRKKRYVPSVLWLEEMDVLERKSILTLSKICIGGFCESPGCRRRAVDCFAGKHLCRDCLVGKTSRQDEEELRREMFSSSGPKSSAGQAINEGFLNVIT